VIEIPEGPVFIASGPLTSAKLSQAIQKLTGIQQVFFYDAVAPIIQRDSIDMDISYRASRYGKNSPGSEGDYINCPLNKEEYYHFVDELVSARRIELHEFEQEINHGVIAGVQKYFEGCLPVEIIARRGRDALAFGPMRPVGLTDLRTGQHAYAIVQLRQDNLSMTLYNMVGFQTNLVHSEQQRVFRMIPGLEQAEFSRFGQMHRNTFIFSPALLQSTLQYRFRDGLFFAGQITGVEGYMGNIATGLLAGWNAANQIQAKTLVEMPASTMIGALCNYISHASPVDFQPMKANFGIMPELAEELRGKRVRGAAYAARSKEVLGKFIQEQVEVNNIA